MPAAWSWGRLVSGAAWIGEPWNPLVPHKRRVAAPVHPGSVALGTGSSPSGFGWVDLLRAALAHEDFNLDVHNLAIGARTTSLALTDLELALQQAVPRIVVVGLSTANEELDEAQTMEQAQAVQVQYTQARAPPAHFRECLRE